MSNDTKLSPTLLEAFYNDPVVHNAVTLWQTGTVSKEQAYEEAVIVLSQQKRDALALVVRAAAQGFKI